MARRTASTGLKVRVRMYRQGFGDCFLLTFKEKGKSTHMLIDCGVHASSPNGPKRIRQVVDHIKKETKGQLGVLAVTHEHWDHVSGFDQAGDVFKTFTVGESWSSWTEDPDDPAARTIKAHYTKARMALVNAMAALERDSTVGLDAEMRARKEGLDGLMGFVRPLGLDEAGGGKVGEAMMWAASSGKTVRHLSPFGGPIEVPGVSGVKVFVLGPPKDEGRLDDDDPKAGEGYRGKMARSLALGGLMADRLTETVAAMNARVGKRRTPAMWDRLTPFTPDYWEMEKPEKDEKGAKKPLVAAAFPAAYTAEEDAWRRIDGAWATAAEELALWMDGHTNNTSLVLAIQLPRSGKVLLFAGDAQAGNWRSWHDKPFTVSGNAVTTRELLAKTVLYKVSHHGSYNATLNKLGLELMTHPDLTAMLPLYMDPLGTRWKMPANDLYTSLMTRTRGRVIWADPSPPAAMTPKATGLTAAGWEKFQKTVANDDLFVEYTVTD